MRKDVKIGVVVGVVLLALGGWYVWIRTPRPAEKPATLTEPVKQALTAEKELQQPAPPTTEAEPLARSDEPQEITVPEPLEPQAAEPSSPPLLTATGAPPEQPPDAAPSPGAELGGANRALEVPAPQPEAPQPTIAPVAEPSADLVPPVEQAPEPAGPAAIGSEPLVHVVVRGESIAKIAERYYGSQAYAGFLLKANPQVRDPKRMAVGTKLTVPPLPAGLRPAGLEPGGQPVRPAKRAEPPAAGAYREYRVRPGDTFYSIAARMLDDSQRWRELLELNFDLVGGKPENLRAGQVIRVPVK